MWWHAENRLLDRINAMPVENDNCDGSGPHLSGEVRVLPMGKDPNHGNLIVCRSCYNREIDYRVERNADVAQPYDLPAWTELKVYAS